jgi:hypothetical protein
MPCPASIHTRAITVVMSFCAGIASVAHAEVAIIPQSALVPSTTLYTADIGGGVGTPLVMTGGGNAANVGGVRNDDGFSGPIPLGFELDFFGRRYGSFFANNNGNVSFGAGISEFTPNGPQGAAAPVVSPFFADVDTRGAASGVLSLRADVPQQIIVTWSEVGHFSANAERRNTFQLVLRGADYALPAGEGRIGFFWTTMQWETGDASGGTNGFGGTPAAVGFGDGLANGQVLAGSTEPGIADRVQNRRLWFDLAAGGVPIVTPPVDGGESVSVIPEPGTSALTALGLVLLAGLGMRRRAASRLKTGTRS